MKNDNKTHSLSPHQVGGLPGVRVASSAEGGWAGFAASCSALVFLRGARSEISAENLVVRNALFLLVNYQLFSLKSFSVKYAAVFFEGKHLFGGSFAP